MCILPASLAMHAKVGLIAPACAARALPTLLRFQAQTMQLRGSGSCPVLGSCPSLAHMLVLALGEGWLGVSSPESMHASRIL